MKKIEKTIKFAGKQVKLSTGHFAQQATSAVMASIGETVVMATVVSSTPKEDWGYFPLMVEYQERLYAGGRIKGSRWVKREGKPSEENILTARLIDRSIRPLFPKYFKDEVQVIITVLSVDLENNPDIVAALAVSAALMASDIPWEGPVAVVRVAKNGKEFISNPVNGEVEDSSLDLIASFTKDSIVMIEAGANQVEEKEIVSAIKFAQKQSLTIIDFLESFASSVGAKKKVVAKNPAFDGLLKELDKITKKDLLEILGKLSSKQIGYHEFGEYKKSVIDTFSEEERDNASTLFEEVVSKNLKSLILSGKRLDGRKADEIRDLSGEIEILPRTHGSAIFKRGQTQVLTVTTIGPSSLEQFIETVEGEETKRYMHHYSMPPYSVGETGRVGFPSRREIGHGALAERALLPVIPEKSEFPYAIRVVSEVLSSNGSTSMASTCASTLSLMDAGVPLESPVAGIAMGLVIKDKKNFVVLTDITGLEDGNGDMDFKVAGTKKGITALQLDVKTLKLSADILKEALQQAGSAKEEILKMMVKVISKSKSKVSTYAPKIKLIKIPQDKIGEVIGPGGKMIKSIIAETGAQVDIEDDGTVSISAMTDKEVSVAVDRIELMVKEVAAGELYEGIVRRIEPFGAFLELFPGKDGMVHVSDMSSDFVNDPKEVVSIGDKVKVKVKEIDNLGRINLTMLLDSTAVKNRSEEGGRSRSESRGRGRDSNRDSNRDSGNRGRRGSGPHFPVSRLVNPKKRNY